MKQRITFKELGKLSDDQKNQLREWWKPSEGDQALCEKYGVVTIHINGEYDDNEPLWINCQYSLMAEDPLPLLTIGQMIELINEKKPLKSISKARFDKWIVNIDTATLGYKDELCDSLWETVTRIL